MRCILKRHKERYACACPSAALEVGTWFSFSPSWALVKDCGRILTSSLLLWYSYFFVNKCQWNRKNWNSEKGIMTEVISRWWQSWWYRSPYIYHKPGHSNAFLKTTSAALSSNAGERQDRHSSFHLPDETLSCREVSFQGSKAESHISGFSYKETKDVGWVMYWLRGTSGKWGKSWRPLIINSFYSGSERSPLPWSWG